MTWTVSTLTHVAKLLGALRVQGRKHSNDSKQ